MDSTFWLQKWEKNEIAFHKSEANPMIVKYLGKLSLSKGSRVFVPLCGKTLDIPWLLSQGYAVDDGVGLHFVGDCLENVVSSRPKAQAYYLERKDGEINENSLDTLYLENL